MMMMTFAVKRVIFTSTKHVMWLVFIYLLMCKQINSKSSRQIWIKYSRLPSYAKQKANSSYSLRNLAVEGAHLSVIPNEPVHG